MPRATASTSLLLMQVPQQLSNTAGNWSVSHCGHFCWISGYTGCADYMAQESCLSPEQMTLFQMQPQVNSADGMEDLSQIHQGAPDVSCMHEEVIEVSYTASLGRTSQDSPSSKVAGPLQTLNCRARTWNSQSPLADGEGGRRACLWRQLCLPIATVEVE